MTRWLQRTNIFWFSFYTASVAFLLYTCIFSFRKTFTAGTFQGLEFAGLSYKSWLVIAQVVGYGLSKFIGIKIISELKAQSRSAGILIMSGIAVASWFFFAITPAPYNIIFLFTNGMPLGMVWGMVFGYLEGRRMTEVLGAGLSVSFIFSAGLSKTVGGYLLRDWGVSEYWMPFVAGLLFGLPMLVFLYLLNQVPPPSPLDEQLRTKRQPMNAAERKHFTFSFLPGIILFVLAYMLFTIFRDVRDNFSAEVWKTLGYTDPKIFTSTEVPISILTLVVMGSLIVIKNNLRALVLIHLIIILGMILLGVATYLFDHHLISAPLWMTLIGLGLYLGYIPFNSIFFDRLLAAFQYAGTVGFIMYVADSFGYLGSVSVLLFKELGLAQLSWVEFFIQSGYVVSAAGTLLIGGSVFYFRKKHATVQNLAAAAQKRK
ncbi:MAG: hypothetical protein JST43_04920 [Bacteroidetes bacterium]|nr:hypothetical protein [Bacteroidota bacterium]MBS1539833.1 hypothetical protein [Bacteroidota bacterium]